MKDSGAFNGDRGELQRSGIGRKVDILSLGKIAFEIAAGCLRRRMEQRERARDARLDGE